jgi:hypothetical protein
MKIPYTLSRKTKISIARNLQSLIDKTYDERCVKELLIDLREISNRIIKGDPNSRTTRIEQFDQIFKDFVDICNCITHPNREISGVLEKNIRRHIKKMAQGLNQNQENVSPADFMKVDTVITEDSIVSAMLASIYLYISKYDSTYTREQLNPVFEDKANVGLCVISLLQDTIIKLSEDKGIAILHVMDHEGQYRLNCRVLGSSIDKDSREMTRGVGHVSIGFPVVVTNAKNIDNLKFNLCSKKLPPLIETYRGEDKNLHVRFIEDL